MSGHTPSEYLKIKYSAPTDACKCGDCQLVPTAVLARWRDEWEHSRIDLQRVVDAENERDEVRTNSNDRIAELNAEAAANEAKIEELTSVLLRIAFNEDVNSLSANPTKWPSEIAYIALGGRIKDGQRLDDRAALTSAGEK